MRKAPLVITCCIICMFGSALTYADRSIELVGDPTVGTTYMLYDHFGGTWHDAEKSADNTEDDLMCWAATASNMLAWGGWGQPGVTGTSSQDIFQYFQDHWTDAAGDARYGIDWWFSGVNSRQGMSGWSQVDVAGGGFYPELSSYDYRAYTYTNPYSIRNIENYLMEGRAVAIWVGQYPPGTGVSHMITCWGVNYTINPDGFTRTYNGVWVTDSDDDKSGDAPRDEWLRYYDVEYDETDARWYIKDYYSYDDIYIGAVTGLLPNPTPEPASVMLLSLGALGLIGRRKKHPSLD